MASMKEIEQFNVRLTPEQKKRLQRLANASGVSLNEYIGSLIDSQYGAVEGDLAEIETLQGKILISRQNGTASDLPKKAHAVKRAA